MNHRPMMAAGLLVVLSLGGCLGGADEEPAATSDEPLGTTSAASEGAGQARVVAPNATDLPAVFTGCTEQLGQFALPEETFSDSIPEGFEGVPFEGIPGTLTAVAFLSSCDSMELGSNATEPVSMLVGAILVDPPAELAGSASDHAVLIGGFTTSEALADVWSDHGLPMEVGEVEFSLTATPAVRVAAGRGEADGFSVDFVGVVPGTPNAASGFTVRVYGYQGARLVGTMDMTSRGGTEYGPGEGNIIISEVPPMFPPALVVHADGEDHGYDVVFTKWPGPLDDIEDGSEETASVHTNGAFENTYQNARNVKNSVK